MTPDWSASPVAVPYETAGNPQSLNLYAYVGNDPIDGEDADGHASQEYGNSGIYDNPDSIAASGTPGASDSTSPASSPRAYAIERGQVSPNVHRGFSERLISDGDINGALDDLWMAGFLAQQPTLQPTQQLPLSVILGSGFPLDLMGVNGNTTTLPLYDSSGVIIGTEAVTNNLNSHDTGTVVVVNTNQSLPGSPTTTETLRLKNGNTNSISVRSSDGSVNVDSRTAYNSHTLEATVTTRDHNTNNINITVYSLAGGSGPVLTSNTTYSTTWIH
jgi:hypothetical protein